MINEVSLDYGIVKIGKIRNTDFSSGLIHFVLNEDYNADYPDDGIAYAKIACPKPDIINIDDECLIVKTNDIAENWYCIGFIQKEENYNKKPNSIRVGETTQAIGNDFYEIKTPNNFINLNDRFSIINHKKNNVSSSIIGGNSKMFLYNKKRLHLESPDILFQSEQGNVNIVGKKTNDSNDIENYLPINQLYVRSQKAFIRTGNYFNITAGRMKIDLSSSKLSSTNPLKGPNEVYHINAIEGDIRSDVGLGDIILNNYNFKFTNKIELRCGSKLHPTASGVELTAKGAKYYLHTTFELIQSYLEFKTGGSAELFSSRNINVKSLYGKVLIDSTQDTLIKSLTKINLSANSGINMSSLTNINITANTGIKASSRTKIEILSNSNMDIISKTNLNLKGLVKVLVDSALIEIKGQMLDLSKSGTINAGPKSSPPTGSGPFCALPTCLFTGAPHSGSIAQ